MKVFLVILAFFFSTGSAQANQAVRQILQLVDYVGVDYQGAVAEGRVLNPSEYEEMADFAATINTLARGLPTTEFSDQILQSASRLQGLTNAKANPASVSAEAAKLRHYLINGYDLSVVPNKAPDLALGKQLFIDNCSSCHGADGRGDGPLAATLQPKPTDFTDLSRYRARTVFGLYNTISHGVEGTAMQAYDKLTDRQRWALAFYAGQLAPSAELKATGERLLLRDSGAPPLIDARELTTRTPAEIEARMGEAGRSLMAYLRAHPQTLFSPGQTSSLTLARQRLDESVRNYRAGDATQAHQLAVSAYLDGFEPVEGNLDAVDATFRRRIEVGMTHYRSLIMEQAPVARVLKQATLLDTLLQEAESRLNSTQLSPSTAFVSSMVILLREGLEAILVIAALAAFLIKTGRRDGLRYLYAGIAGAIGLGMLTWVLSTYVVQIGGAGRELTEGFAALFAALMLFYVGFWLQSKTKATQWKAFIEGRVKKTLGKGTLWGLSGLAFIAVYREIFEMVLFYQALWIQTSKQGQSMIFTGLLIAVVLLLLLGWLILRYSTRLPLRQFFSVSGIFMFLLAIVFTGKGIAALQEAGKLPINIIDIPQIDLLGIYPNLEGILAQSVLALFAIALLLKDRTASRKAMKT